MNRAQQIAPKKCAKAGKMVGQYRAYCDRNLRGRLFTFLIPYRNLRSIAMTDIAQLLGKDADSLYSTLWPTIPSDQVLFHPADYVDRVMIDNNRPPAVLRNMQTPIILVARVNRTFDTARRSGWSTRRRLFAANPRQYFDPKILY